jgi:peptidoglycan/LPS O-acetylase OafA/YrhL
MPQRYISNLTALRGIAALLTVIYHVDVWIGNGGGMLLPNAATGLLHRMYLMVDFFFILSGFIMYHVYGDWFKTTVTADSFKQFIKARFARVYPLHILMLFAMMLVYVLARRLGIPPIPPLEAENHTYSFITNLFLLHSMNFHNSFTWVHASWSISTEWWMYMVFPFLMIPFSKLNTGGRILITGLCVAGYWLITLVLLPLVTLPQGLEFMRTSPSEVSINVSYQFGFVRCFVGFVLGMMVYQAFLLDWGKRLFSNGTALLLFTLGLLICFHLNLPDAVSVLFFPFIILASAYGSDAINRILASKPLQKLGDWSFSIYLVHQPLILLLFIISMSNQAPANGAAAGAPPPIGMGIGWAICLVVVAFTLLVSALVYRFWERPLRLWINPNKKVVA